MFSHCYNKNCVDIVQGIFMDDAAGMRDSDVVYVDTNSEQIESLPDTALHRPVDLAIVGADKEGQSSLWLFKAAVHNLNTSP
jgi:hypothetical protein